MLPHFFTSLIPCIQVTGIVRGNDEDYFSSSEKVSLWIALCGLELANQTDRL